MLSYNHSRLFSLNWLQLSSFRGTAPSEAFSDRRRFTEGGSEGGLKQSESGSLPAVRQARAITLVKFSSKLNLTLMN